MSSNFTVLFDANVLYPAPLRDFLMRLALTDLFRAKWTNMIHDEWMRNVLKKRPELKKQLERTKQLMNSSVRDCLVEDFDHLIPTIELPDKNDRHVVAAAIQGQADMIVTFNLKDFPQSALDKYKLEAQHPDDFIFHQMVLQPALVCQAAAEHRQPQSTGSRLKILRKHRKNIWTPC
jgi:predicted nucleic acid-binding protein